MYSRYMFQLQVTIIRQTFQYMDMTCSVLTAWDPILVTETFSNFTLLNILLCFD